MFHNVRSMFRLPKATSGFPNLLAAGTAIALWLANAIIVILFAASAYKGLDGSPIVHLLSVQDLSAAGGAIVATYIALFVIARRDTIARWHRRAILTAYVSAFGALLLASHGCWMVVFGTNWAVDRKDFLLFAVLVVGGFVGYFFVLLRSFVVFVSSDQPKHVIHTIMVAITRVAWMCASAVTTIVAAAMIWYLLERGALGGFDLNVESVQERVPMFFATVLWLGLVVFALYYREILVGGRTADTVLVAADETGEPSRGWGSKLSMLRPTIGILLVHKGKIARLFALGLTCMYVVLLHSGMVQVLWPAPMDPSPNADFVRNVAWIMYTTLIVWGAPNLVNPAAIRSTAAVEPEVE